MKMCEVEPAVFYMRDAKDSLKSIKVTHVDDFLFAGEEIFLDAIAKMKSKIKIGKSVDSSFKFCGLEINSEKDGSLTVKLESEKTGEVTRIPTDGLTERRMTGQEETKVRGKIGQLQCYASVRRPDLSFMLGDLFSTVNTEKHTDQIRDVNTIIGRFIKHGNNYVTLRPKKRPIAIEVFGDSSFRDNNQQGFVTAMRQTGTKRCNLVGWRIQESDRRAWSTHAAETHVMRNDLTKAVGMKTFLQQLGIRVKSVKVLTDNLSLKRVIYSGRQTQEMRLRREIAINR